MQALQYPFDSAALLKNRRRLRKQLLAEETTRIPKRIAVLGGSTTTDIVSMLELFLLSQGIQPSFYQSEYGQYWQDAMFPNEALEAFAPDLIFIHTTGRNLTEPMPGMQEPKAACDAAIERQYDRFAVMWERLTATYHCPIIQNNFEMPAYRLLGNADASDPHGKTYAVQRLNLLFAEYAASHSDFYLHDIQYLSACYGLDAWLEPSYWYLYKYALCVPAIPQFAYSLSTIIKSLYGKNKKVLALDLDNTLWGGVIGDDGVDGIEIGQETPLAQAYSEFQSYVKAQKSLGVLLTVCSKNEPENAALGLSHPDNVLHEEDFVCLEANWNPKDESLVATANALNLLPESIVFVDDNPAERAIVRAQLPQTAVPELSNVEQYIRVLDRSGFFEMTTFSQDDAARNEMYRANAARAAQQRQFSDYAEYLQSLGMQAEIDDFQPIYLARITQLTNKSNQFNLTTKRYTESEMRLVAESERYIRLSGRLCDRFGDNGIVSVVIGEKRDDTLEILLWLMSCRVLKRDMEYAMLDRLVEKSRAAGIRTLIGIYLPSNKNKMVRDLYERFGFEKCAEEPDGATRWRLSIEGYQPKNHVIHIKEREKMYESD